MRRREVIGAGGFAAAVARTVVVEWRHGGAGVGQAGGRLVGEQHRRCRVGQDRVQPGGRVVRVQRHVRRAGPEHAEQADQQRG